MRSIVLSTALGVAAIASPASAVVLYNGAANPSPNIFSLVRYPGAAGVQTVNAASVTLDTTSADSVQVGYTNNPITAGLNLNRATGYTLRFDVRVLQESHASSDRAGFSVIAISSDGTAGIELGFWGNEVWAQDDSPLFTHGEGAAHDTTAALRRYELAVLGSAYTLYAAGSPLLTGALRDYTAFAGSPDPYQTANFIYLGDDTQSAQARIELAYVEVLNTAVPEPSTLALLAMAGLAWGRRR